MFAYNPVYQVPQVPMILSYFDELKPSKPRILKKVETEDSFQVYLFKEYGNFDRYEIKAVKHPQGDIVNLVLFSEADNFKKVFQVNFNEVELQDLQMEWLREHNVLVLTIPKKSKCFDYYGLPGFLNVALDSSHYKKLRREEKERKREHKRAEDRHRKELKKQRELEFNRELERQELERKREQARQEERRRELERQRKEAERQREKQRKEAERRQEEYRQQEIQRQEAIRQLEIQRQQELARQYEARRAEAERVTAAAYQTQQFLSQMFGFPHVIYKSENEAERQPQVEETANEKGNSEPEPATPDPKPAADVDMKDTESESDHSISSDAETESTTAPSTPKTVETLSSNLHKHPSIEEVEDEEFVILRKKFGQ